MRAIMGCTYLGRAENQIGIGQGMNDKIEFIDCDKDLLDKLHSKQCMALDFVVDIDCGKAIVTGINDEDIPDDDNIISSFPELFEKLRICGFYPHTIEHEYQDLCSINEKISKSALHDDVLIYQREKKQDFLIGSAWALYSIRIISEKERQHLVDSLIKKGSST